MDKEFVNALIESGIHFGHRAGRWNPKMKPYIFCTRNSIHIVDIKETIKGLLRSKKLLAKVVASGHDVLFVGTKRQARRPVEEQAARCGMHYVTERWLGGILTNFRTIRSRLGRLEELEAMEESGELATKSKKMQSTLKREMHKIRTNLDGIRRMDRLPGALVIVDARREYIAANEARKLGIPTICLIDTDSDPDTVDLAIPGNDDAMKAIALVVRHLAEATLEGKEGRTEAEADGRGGRDGQRRSRRVTTAQAAEGLGGGNASPAESVESDSESASDRDQAVVGASESAGSKESGADN